MPVQHRQPPWIVLSGLLAAAGVVLAIASCSGITPLGAGPVQLPPARHLGSPIVLQAMGVQPYTATDGCPAGWAAVSLPAGGGPQVAQSSTTAGPPQRVTTAVSAGPASPTPSPPLPSSAPPQPSAPPAPINCYRPIGTPVTITSAAVSSVLTFTPPPGQARGPDVYGFIVGVPDADVAAVTAVIRHAYDTKSAVGITVAGKLWQAPMVFEPFRGEQLQISLLSRNQAVQLYRMLVPST